MMHERNRELVVEDSYYMYEVVIKGSLLLFGEGFVSVPLSLPPPPRSLSQT